MVQIPAECCESCRAWRRLDLSEMAQTEEGDRGNCRRWAPFALSNGEVLGLARWPLTLASSWCGDWLPMPKVPGR